MASSRPVPAQAVRSPSGGLRTAAQGWAAALVAGGHDALFAIKTFLAAMLAYGIALEIGLQRPFWAIITCFIVAQPLAGAVLSKAAFRLIGTAVGAAVAVALVPPLVDAPEWLCAALALWLGLCTYLSMLDRSPRAYVFLLSGYTAAIIGFPAVAAPGHVFDIAVVRGEEIGLGILTSTLVHALVFPRSVAAPLMQRIDRMMADAADVGAALLGADVDRVAQAGRRRLIGDFAEIDTLATHLPYDLSRRHVRGDLLHALQHELMQILAMAGAVRDRVRRLGDAMPPEIAALLDDVAAWIGQGGSAAGDGDALIGRARALEPLPGARFDRDAALRLILLDRLAALVAAHRDSRAIGAAIRRPRPELSPRLAAIVREARRPRRHRDRGTALRGAIATAGTALVGCAFWIATAWPDGASAVVLASIVCALYANLDEPGKASRHVLYGVLIAVGIAAIYAFALLPRITEFPVLAMALAPAFLIVSTLNQQPGCAALSIGMIVALPGLIGLGDRYTGDFAAFANNAVAQIGGACLAALLLALVRSVGAETARSRLMAAARRDLARRFAGERAGTTRQWVAAMLDRVALLSKNAGGGEEAQVASLLRLLRLGIAVDAMHAVARRVGGRDALLIRQMLRRGRSALLAGETGASSEALFDLALARASAMGQGAASRSTILAITALRYNL